MTDKEKRIAQNTLAILKKKSWKVLNFEEVLKNNKNINIKSKIDLLKNINRYVDDALIIKMKKLEISSTKDMLFEVLMARFDILQQNRKSYLEIYKAFKKSPQYFIKLLPSFLESMIITAELAKYNVNGLKGTIRLKGLMMVYFATFFQWLEDKTTSLERTMTQLDKNLDQAEKFGKLVS
ncbi:MAG: hypothetical protein HOF20_03395 [Pelagibacteraceae bacterium]|jgi:hypothetical protein|nr:hypothetical protein [Pelagibacteraceae bacterium]MBT4646558.1 hypothetical protein [Pelagibacteraceae bacterium]MBT6354175.1 hypothetical protein [Pelagibacteraceae bacterium]